MSITRIWSVTRALMLMMLFSVFIPSVWVRLSRSIVSHTRIFAYVRMSRSFNPSDWLILSLILEEVHASWAGQIHSTPSSADIPTSKPSSLQVCPLVFCPTRTIPANVTGFNQNRTQNQVHSWRKHLEPNELLKQQQMLQSLSAQVCTSSSLIFF